jgi:hypothetical protein
MLRMLPGVVAAPFVAGTALAQHPYNETPPLTLTMEQASREIATLKVQMSVGLSILSTINREMRKINSRLGNPGPNHTYEKRGKRT